MRAQSCRSEKIVVTAFPLTPWGHIAPFGRFEVLGSEGATPAAHNIPQGTNRMSTVSGVRSACERRLWKWFSVRPDGFPTILI